MSDSTQRRTDASGSIAPSDTGLFARMRSMDTSKKYTLVFLISVGTTLLVTGASGGRLLKRAKRAAPGASDPASVKRGPVSAVEAVRIPSAPPKPVPKPPATFETSLPAPPTPLFADPTSLSPRRSLLRSWRNPSAPSNSPSAYFLPNSTILSGSNLFASALDKADKLHEQGSTVEPDLPDDGFNPAVYAFKAFAIATAITVSTFAAAIYALMRHYDSHDLEHLALALSQSVPSAISSRRPTIPAWARPEEVESTDASSTSQTDVEREELSYWASVKESLDKEAAEMKAERRRNWERIQAEKGSGPRLV